MVVLILFPPSRAGVMLLMMDRSSQEMKNFSYTSENAWLLLVVHLMRVWLVMDVDDHRTVGVYVLFCVEIVGGDVLLVDVEGRVLLTPCW